MKRYEYEKAVYDSGANSVAKAILLYYGHRKNWAADGKVWVSAATVARDLSISVSSINRRVPKLRDSGWLVPTGRVVGNGAVEYDLAIGQPFPTKAAGVTPAPGPDATLSQTGTPVTQHTTTGTETEKEVTNKRDNEMKEEVKADAEAPVIEFPEVRKDSNPSSSPPNPKSTLAVQSRKNYLNLVSQMEEDKKIGREVLEELLAGGDFSDERASAARKLFESSSFMPHASTGQRAAYAVYWGADTETIPPAAGTGPETW